MDLKTAQKIAYTVNSVMLSMIFLFLGFFIALKAELLVWFSIPTAVVYTFTYFLIYKEHLNIYLWTVYSWLILYTVVVSVCLGESYGFQLYCFSMIPVVYAVEYMSYKLGRNGVRSLYISIIVALIYLLIMGYLSKYGPVYDCGKRFAVFFSAFNSLTVFGYLVIYTNYLIRTIIKSETKLKEMAHRDRLTKLYNRHYMLDKLSMLSENESKYSLAMADIDDFKKINDHYGHNAGDEVLKTVSARMRERCSNCDIARWGGEEFLILLPVRGGNAVKMLEEMRSDICSAPVKHEEQEINVSVTIGLAERNDGQSIDEWIQSVDEKLYRGKHDGKNRLVV